ncbi:ATP-binding protein [Chitinimonas sp.]|uniref:ATP-binding protein n=1 Tax=Chitinimonas sp. TaxID=1934313 RepID=UPI0035AF9181
MTEPALMALLHRLERFLPEDAQEPDWSQPAFRWRRRSVFGHGFGVLEAVAQPNWITLGDLHNIASQQAEIVRNTRQFVAGHLANNVLLTGARGTGKSSLIKAVLQAFHRDGLRLVEVDKADLVDLPDIVARLLGRPERFIVFCDDLSFEEGETGYKALKSVLDGSIAAHSSNVLVYATSNRRHLLPEFFDENRQARHVDGEVHPGDAVEEKISLSERFGLWLSFYPFSQAEYLHAVRHWLQAFGVADWSEEVERAALLWAQGRGARSGRVAWQFARDWAGRCSLPPLP